MNPAEHEQLSQFLTQLVAINLTEKDSAAESMITEAINRQPNAAYLLVQRCLLQNQALQQAQSQIADLQNQLQQKDSRSLNSSFLNGDPWSPASNPPRNTLSTSNFKTPVASTNNPEYARPMQQPPAAAGLGSSFLGNIATTAAGVVAGSFLFHGIGNLLGQHYATPDLNHHSLNNEHTPEQTADHKQDHEEDNPFHLANDTDSDSYFDDSDSDSDWI